MILEEKKDIGYLSNFKTPAKTRYFYEISYLSQLPELKKVFEFITKNNLPHLVVGGGTNLLFAFDEFPGVIIKNSLKGWEYDTQSKILSAFSSESIRTIAQDIEKKYEQPLWHRFIGLPGSIGGAVFGNAGCFGLETENNFLSAEVLNIETGEIEILSKAKMNFSYRSSVLKTSQKYFLIKANFNLSEKVEKYHSEVDNIDFRENKQPKGNSCGSFFKNPEGYIIDTPSGHDIIRDQQEAESLKREGIPIKKISAGMLIEMVGMKGHTFQGAKWSEKHANFLISVDESCTWKSLVYLIEEAQKKVQDQFGITLENEVRIIKY